MTYQGQPPRVLVKRLKTQRHSRRDVSALKVAVGGHQVIGDCRSCVNHQHIGLTFQMGPCSHCGSDAVAAQGVRRGISQSDGQRGLVSEAHQVLAACSDVPFNGFGVLFARRAAHDGPAGLEGAQESFQHHYVFPSEAVRRHGPGAVKVGHLHRCVAVVYCDNAFHQKRKISKSLAITKNNCAVKGYFSVFFCSRSIIHEAYICTTTPARRKPMAFFPPSGMNIIQALTQYSRALNMRMR